MDRPKRKHLYLFILSPRRRTTAWMPFCWVATMMFEWIAIAHRRKVIYLKSSHKTQKTENFPTRERHRDGGLMIASLGPEMMKLSFTGRANLYLTFRAAPSVSVEEWRREDRIDANFICSCSLRIFVLFEFFLTAKEREREKPSPGSASSAPRLWIFDRFLSAPIRTEPMPMMKKCY